MHLERLLARYRAAVKTAVDGPPFAQRVVSGGCMSQILHEHRVVGGSCAKRPTPLGPARF